MADKSKMSIEEILAAARKTDGGASPSPKPAEKSEAAAPESDGESESAAVASESTPATSKSVPKPGSADRPSVADIMAMARGGSGSAPAKAAPKKEKPAAPVVKDKASPKAPPAKKAEPIDTQSILAAARKSKQPGPMTKAEAAAKAPSSPSAAKKSKEAIVVPPMPKRPEYAKPTAARAKVADEPTSRRNFLFGLSALAVGFTGLALTSVAWGLATVRFMFPNVLREPPSRFKIGFPDQFPPEQVENKFKAQFGIWVVNTTYNGEPEIFALRTVCTHLGCTPNWLEAEQKFKCPCHGSGFYKDGINFEGPAPRPLERYAISIGDDGQLEVDKSRLFQEELGQWNDPASFVPV